MKKFKTAITVRRRRALFSKKMGNRIDKGAFLCYIIQVGLQEVNMLQIGQAAIAQSVVRRIGSAKVTGPNPVSS